MPETLVDAKVTYTVEYDGQVYIVEHVPAKVSQDTGEQYFAPETVERIRILIKSRDARQGCRDTSLRVRTS